MVYVRGKENEYWSKVQNQGKTVIFFNKFGNALEKSLDELARFGEPDSCLLQRVWLAFPSISAIPLYVTQEAHV